MCLSFVNKNNTINSKRSKRFSNLCFDPITIGKYLFHVQEMDILLLKMSLKCILKAHFTLRNKYMYSFEHNEELSIQFKASFDILLELSRKELEI